MSPDQRKVRTQLVTVDLTVKEDADPTAVADELLELLFANIELPDLNLIVSFDGTEPQR
jgi:hypothetical protein